MTRPNQDQTTSTPHSSNNGIVINSKKPKIVNMSQSKVPENPTPNSFIVDINFNITTNINKIKGHSPIERTFDYQPVKVLKKRQDSPRVEVDVYNSIKEEQSKLEDELVAYQQERRSISSSSVSSSSSGSPFNLNPASIPKIRISNYDEVKDISTLNRNPSNKLKDLL